MDSKPLIVDEFLQLQDSSTAHLYGRRYYIPTVINYNFHTLKGKYGNKLILFHLLQFLSNKFPAPKSEQPSN